MLLKRGNCSSVDGNSKCKSDLFVLGGATKSNNKHHSTPQHKTWITLSATRRYHPKAMQDACVPLPCSPVDPSSPLKTCHSRNCSRSEGKTQHGIHGAERRMVPTPGSLAVSHSWEQCFLLFLGDLFGFATNTAASELRGSAYPTKMGNCW